VTTARTVFDGSVAADTRRYLKGLSRLGPRGQLAASLFRAQKASTRAKFYHGGIKTGYGRKTFRDLAYDHKQDAINAVCELLQELSGRLVLTWGWGEDKGQSINRWVLYVELPTGQVSFHSPQRGAGPDYLRGWDGANLSCERISQWCDSIVEARDLLKGDP